MDILKKIYNPFLKRYESYLKKKFDDLKIQNSKNFFFNLELNLKNISDIDQTNYKVFSQNGEDGIIQYLIKTLKLNYIKFVEIGTQDYLESNTRYIFQTMRCDGLIIDPLKNLETLVKKNIPKFWKNNLKIINKFATPENINSLLDNNNFQNDIDLFSLDVDGIDYWLINKLKKNISKIFIAEYNPYFGPELEITVPNINNFDRTSYHYSNLCWGVSLKSLIKIMTEKDYTFLGSNDLRNNAFFISNSHIHKIKINKPKIENLFEFTNATYKESRDQNGKLTFIEPKKILYEIKDCEVIDLKSNKLVKIRELL
jgi:mRNA-degrading endonuclease HigB of HigAB toxin-antitoxin module